MALITRRIDDLDGSETDVETVHFALDGTDYEVDLSPENRQRLTGALDRYLKHARNAPQITKPTRSRGGKKSPAASNREEIQRIRTWARENGHTVSDRGRISAAIQDAYRAAHQG